jgi:8-hydroxy-5-deazaflavin:NADPH oxidoreductase
VRIAIIGVGNVGSAFGRAAVQAGHDVILAAQHPEKARSVADEIGAAAAESNTAAVEGAQIVLLAVPGSHAPAVAAEVASALAPGAVLLDASNPLNESYSDLAVESTSGAEDVQNRAGGAPVVKAFNTIFASRYANPTENGEPLHVLLAGDDAAAKSTVADVAATLGFAPVDAGGLRMARALEEMAFLNIALNAANGWAWQSAWQLVGPRG